MTAATINKANASTVELWRKCLACLLSVTITLMPVHGWANAHPPSPLSDEEISKLGREAQQFGKELSSAAKLPSLTKDGKIDLGAAGTISVQDLHPDIAQEMGLDSLMGMHDSAEEMGKAGEKAQKKLEEESNKPTPSTQGMVYDVVKQARNRARPTFENDKDFKKSRDLLSPGGMQKFMETFSDCVAEEKFHKKEFLTRIPDYQFCHKLYKPKGGCTIHHTIEIATEPADIVFLVDNSGSMEPVIADLRNNVRNFAALVNQGKRGNLRIGGAVLNKTHNLRNYGFFSSLMMDHGQYMDHSQYNETALTDNIDQFQDWINRVSITYGDTYPFREVAWAADHYPWRPNVHRIIVLIGNEDQGGDKWRAVDRLNSHGVKLYVFHDNHETKSIGTHLADHFSGTQLLKFAQFLTVVKDSWHPQSCINDAATISEGFCKGSYRPFPASDNECVNISGFNVCKGDSIYHKLGPPPLPNLHKLATRVEVSELNCNFNHGVGSCWIDPQGEKQCLQNNKDIDDCTALQNKGCVFISSECVDGSKGKLGNCYVWKEKWDCGEDVAIPTLEKSVEYRCAGPIRCMGEDCVDVSHEQNSDFARAAALLQVSQFLAQDMDCKDITNQNNAHCQLFAGTAGECKVAVGGAQNCCKKPDGISMNDYLSLVLAVPKLDSAIMALDKGNSLKTAYQSMRQPFADTWTKVKSPFTSGFESISNKVKPITEPFKKVYEQTIGKLKAQINKISAKIIGKAGGQGAGQAAGAAAGKGAEQAGQKAAEKGAEKGIEEAGKKAVEKGATEVLGSLLGTAMTIYTIYSVSMLMIKLIWKCEQKEFELNAKRALDSCHYVGSYCKSEVLGICVESRESYCCFNSPLSRIMQEQIRPQLGLSFGNSKNPECGGIPMEKLNQVDWSKVNLDEWLAVLQKNGRLPTVDNLNLEAITGAGSVLNVDGKRKNVNERTKERIKGIEVDAIRREAAEGASSNHSRMD